MSDYLEAYNVYYMKTAMPARLDYTKLLPASFFLVQSELF